MKIKLHNQNIINRHEPCLCGCGGKDPWHAKNFKRTVTIDESMTEGLARFPWGVEEVNRKKYILDSGKITFGAWKRTNA